MKHLALVALMLPLLGSAHAAPSESSGADCPVGSPSPDGSRALPGSPCVLTDIRGVSWRFSTGKDPYGNKQIQIDNGRGFQDFSYATTLEINDGGNIYIEVQRMLSPYRGWGRRNQGNGEFYQVASGGSALPSPPFLNNTTSKRYQSMRDMVQAAAAGSTLEANIMPSGFPMYFDGGVFRADGVTFNCDAGTIIGAVALQGQAPFNIQANNVTVDGCEIAYSQAGYGNGPARGISLNRNARGFTGSNLNVHDNDHGLLASGANGTVTLTNDVFSHNGCSNGCGSGAPGSNHNVYLSWNNSPNDTDSVTISGGKSVCPVGGGDPLKLRFASGMVSNFTAAGSDGSHDDCSENWPIDFPCGGDYIVGSPGTGQGVVIERSPHAQNYGIIRYAEEIGVPANCPHAGRTYRLVIQNAWIIDDGPSDSRHPSFVVCAGRFSGGTCTSRGYSLVVRDSKIVAAAFPGCAGNHLGPNVIDGGGNTCYSSRAAAGLAAYPALPATP